jgi:predicted YcjX-like family ATPase
MKSKIYLRNKIVYNFFTDVFVVINKQILNINYLTNENKKIHAN